MSHIQDSFMRCAGVCSVLAPLPLLAADIMKMTGSLGFERTIIEWVSFVLFIPAIFALSYLPAAQGSRLAFVGGAIAYLGAIAGSNIQVLFRVWVILNESGSSQIVSELLRANRRLTIPTLSIGIFFPLGLFILAVALYERRVVNPLIALLLAGGAILFPIAHIPGMRFGRVIGDVLLIAAFGAIGSNFLSTGKDELSGFRHRRTDDQLVLEGGGIKPPHIWFGKS